MSERKSLKKYYYTEYSRAKIIENGGSVLTEVCKAQYSPYGRFEMKKKSKIKNKKSKIKTVKIWGAFLYPLKKFAFI